MKKPLLNIAVSMALSSAVFSGSVLSTQAYANQAYANQSYANPAPTNQVDVTPAPADETVPEDVALTDNINSNNNTSETYLYPGMGVGAATGTIVAGPVGFVVGGVIGALIGSNQDVTADDEELASAEDDHSSTLATISLQEEQENKIASASFHVSDAENNERGIQLAQLGPLNPVIVNDDITTQEKLMNILVSDLSLDVYFRSGSSDIEKFYPARLAAIADLVNTMDKLELHLDGYTDRRGNREQNIALANKRIEKVREQLISAGVDENRIVSKAFGEAKIKSDAGNLEAYTFDRRVVIRFERARTSLSNSMAAAFAATDSDESTASAGDESSSTQTSGSISPVVADATTRF
jgi:sortase system peptidoglycan-associated protein